MTKKLDKGSSILILGSGPIIIGQACEFDYAGVQACKILRKDGYRVILINSNPATIMTDIDVADVTYIEPICVDIIYNIIKKEKPNALLATMGGQIAINCALELYKKGILSEFNIKMIGVSIDSIYKSENRDVFNREMKIIGLNTISYKIINNLDEAIFFVKKIGFPCVIRPSFTMGGSGASIVYNYKELKIMCLQGLSLSPVNKILIDESLLGWKEYEIEIMRDIYDNCIIICSIENIDPIGIHTGDSISVAPAQTLTDKEYQIIRSHAINIVRRINISGGGCNIQFAVNPNTGKIVVIEMNPRVSRSSALASKATGFPIAKISAKLAVGCALDELVDCYVGSNYIKKDVFFEPVLDYIVTKIPRFNFEKFLESNDRLGIQMKSVGEVMAIGSTFQESLQKALRSLDIGANGFESKIDIKEKNLLDNIYKELQNPGCYRIFYIADAFRLGISVKKIHQLTGIDSWFLFQIKDIIKIEKNIQKHGFKILKYNYIKFLKKKGFSDSRLSMLLGCTELNIRKIREKYNLRPSYKKIDSCSAEFNRDILGIYSTYEEYSDEFITHDICNNKIIVLGSGPNRIGQGIEFDYCCVHALKVLKEDGYFPIMINCNPATVSTDYDMSERLYFEPITLENILEIINLEKPKGIIVQYGGQTSLNLSIDLELLGVPILGTTASCINKAENREIFKEIIKNLGLKQPDSIVLKDINLLLDLMFVKKIMTYPLIIRPSYILGGRLIEIIYNNNDLLKYIERIKIESFVSSILIDKFIDNGIEVEVDAVCDGTRVVIFGIMENIEHSGIHSGDSACSFPTYTLSKDIINKIIEQVKKISFSLNIIGLINIQFIIKENVIYVIEVNPRASRTIPFVSKSIGLSVVKIATRVMLGISLLQQGFMLDIVTIRFFTIKQVVIPFDKFLGSELCIGPEMHSTGEVMGIGDNFSDAFSKAMLSIGYDILKCKDNKILLSLCKYFNYKKVIDLIYQLIINKFKIDIMYNTWKFLKTNNILNDININNIHNIINIQEIYNIINNQQYTYIINTMDGEIINKNETKLIHQYAIKHNIYHDKTINSAFATILSLKSDPTKNLRSLQEKYNFYK